ncbi:DsbA family protein [Vibrio sp. JC009]|uniref:DsbA family protein n=1 Tax=Vibrio sp. JC009 TaxID=2912314 RepID=UPI0023AE89D6|nr:thioredoxin domain-containing protein [Vibrio sp. JC009]WED22929.1 DsbA family protein [Vibrio sp. JC009]
MKIQNAIGALFLGSAAISSAAVNSAPMRLPADSEIQKVLYQFAETYICPNNQISLLDSVEDGLPCPKGQNAIPMIYKNLKSGEWDISQVVPLATGEFQRFRPENIEQLVNVGNKDAPVVVIEYTDPQCPFCSYYMKRPFTEIKKRYIDTGKIQYRYHHTPLSFHKDAFLASEANYCASEQGAYASYHKLLLNDTQKQGKEYLIEYAKQTDLDMDKFTRCLDSHKFRDQVAREKALIDQVTPITYPFFVIGHYDSGEFQTQAVYGAPWLHVVDSNQLISRIEKELQAVY